MTYRIHMHDDPGESVLSFLGDLDRAAFEDLASRIEERTRIGRRVRLVLKSGTSVESEIVEALVSVRGADLEAESSFLAHWIESARKQSKEE